MRRIREVLRLRFAQGLSECAIAASPGLGKGSVGTYLRRARDVGLAWPLPDGLDDDSLELLLFPDASDASDADRPVPDWAAVDKELRRHSVTRMLHWQEYHAQPPNGFGYAWFCTHFEAWKGRVRPSMRQTHVGGEKVFIDFAGDTIDIVDPATGEVSEAKLFVAASRQRRAFNTMGASSYTYTVAVASEGLEGWSAAHVGMFAYLGGVPQVVVPEVVVPPSRQVALQSPAGQRTLSSQP
jgi:transposase